MEILPFGILWRLLAFIFYFYLFLRLCYMHDSNNRLYVFGFICLCARVKYAQAGNLDERQYFTHSRCSTRKKTISYGRRVISSIS